MSIKVQILEEQFDKALYAALSEEELLVEDDKLTKSDVDQIAKKAVKTYLEAGRMPELETKIRAMVRDMVKNDKEVEKFVVEIAKNVLVQLYKALWSKRSFWTSDLKNTSS
jgi:hypothetical protein